MRACRGNAVGAGRFAFLILLAVILQTLVAGRVLASDAVDLLERAANASRALSYSGIYIYHHGEHVEVLRVLHRVENGAEQERVDVLEGMPRQFLRLNNDVYCHLPDGKVRLERNAARRFFPAILPAKPASLLAYYRVDLGGQERVAGRATQHVRLRPRDAYRHAFDLWVDKQSGLPLKARITARTGEVVSMFVFSEMQVGTAPDDSFFVNDLSGKKIFQASLDAPPAALWLVSPPPGFALVQQALRPLSDGKRAITHQVYSDGLSAMSLFIEPVSESSIPFRGLSVEGAIAVYSRQVGGYKVTALGEVPSAALIQTGNSVRRK